MMTNGMKGQTTGFRAAALLAVLGATVVMAGPAEDARVAGDAVALEEVVLVTKTTSPTAEGNFDLPLLGGGGGGGLPLLGSLPLLGGGGLPLLGG